MEVAGYFQGACLVSESALPAQPACQQCRGKQGSDQEEDQDSQLTDRARKVAVFNPVVNQPSNGRTYNEEHNQGSCQCNGPDSLSTGLLLLHHACGGNDNAARSVGHPAFAFCVFSCEGSDDFGIAFHGCTFHSRISTRDRPMSHSLATGNLRALEARLERGHASVKS